jgi:hypothetical protein
MKSAQSSTQARNASSSKNKTDKTKTKADATQEEMKNIGGGRHKENCIPTNCT